MRIIIRLKSNVKVQFNYWKSQKNSNNWIELPDLMSFDEEHEICMVSSITVLYHRRAYFDGSHSWSMY